MANQENEFETFTPGEVFYESENLPLQSSEGTANWNLIFLGTAPGVIYVGYRETSGSKIRPGHDLHLTFCSSGRFFFTVKNERFEVNLADNDGLEIRHLTSGD